MRNASLFDLAGHKALITGASRGIGRAIAQAISAAGADVAVSARSVASLEETCTTIRKEGGIAHPLAMDVTRVSQCARTINQAASLLGGLDILVNNAGTEEVRPSLEVDETLWDRIVDTNLKGAFFCAQSAAKIMSGNDRSGVIINLCSLTSFAGVPGAVPYGSSKSGLVGMTRALAVEWAPLNIRVNAIAPGYFRTAMTEVFYQKQDWQDKMLAKIPLARLKQDWQDKMLAKIPLARFGALSDLYGIAVFLASDASAYITGQCFPVEGGLLASI